MPDENPNKNTEGKDWRNYHSLAPSSEQEREAKAKELLEWIEHNKKYYGESKEEFERGKQYYKKVIVAFASWLDKFPARSEVHELVGYDS